MKRFAAVSIAIAFATSAVAGESQGISGHMVAALGNAPAIPPTFECAKIYDESGQKLIANATCSGAFAQFRVPLVSGRYLVEFKGIEPNRQIVSVSEGKWTELGPKPPRGPVP
jgi:hypothetical protein